MIHHRTRGHKRLTVDLHGLSLAAAMNLSARALAEDAESLTIITGRGKHSPGGKAVIKPELESYLSRNGYWWHHQEPGRGENLIMPEYDTKKRVNLGAIVISRL